LCVKVFFSLPAPVSVRRGSGQYFRDLRNRVCNSLRLGTYNLLYMRDICQEEYLPRRYTHNLNIATESCFTSRYIQFIPGTTPIVVMYISGIESLVKY